MLTADLRKLNNDAERSRICNNKGFSLVELLVTIALMIALVSVVTGSIVTLYKARTKSASEKVGGIMSQCKINSLSGIANYMELSYDDEANEYVCRLFKNNGEIYKTEQIGNSFVDIVANGTSIRDGQKLYISFACGNGAVEMFEVGDGITEITKTESLDLSYDIVFSSGTAYKITLYTMTGEHTVEKI